MNEAQQIHLMLKGLLTECPEEERAKIVDGIEKIRVIVSEMGDLGTIAVTIIAAELAVQN